MTSNDFRRCALSMPTATESAHMDHPDFRVDGRVFASLGYPNDGWGMVKLPPAEQEEFTRNDPEAFTPVKGAWGRAGATSVRLASVQPAALRKAMTAAWEFTALAKVRLKPRSRKRKRS